MKTLALVIPSLNGGGSERVFSILANELSQHYRIKLILLKSGGVYLENVISNVEVVQLNESSIIKSVPKLIKCLKSLSPDVIMSTLGSVNLIMAIIKPFLPSAKLIARESSILSINNKSEKYPKLFDFLFKVFYRKFDLIICQSKYMQRDIVDNFNVDYKKTIVINNPVVIPKSPKGKNESCPAKLNFLSVGRLEHVKGFDLLLDVIKGAIDNGSNLSLKILGDGSKKEELSQKISDLKLDKYVELIGFVSNPQDFMNEADALLISSRYEGFPNVVLEAGSNGLPVIGFNSPGGISEIIDDKNLGVLIDNFNVTSLANEISKFSSENYSINDIYSLTKNRYSTKTIMGKYHSSVEKVIEG
ncbi:glycosyltransferase [Vibrio sp. J1-1]|uniref:glycosyltransferase n=1 Tax=Vibrio sp. J1-1 TaxID=2912251 RepID=UPI001F35FF99|nr:glycosyltransferase [Vibrio sp. J1-1]MCF7482051.1 glycosyltransferase [Vibrio sp. J1-1]